MDAEKEFIDAWNAGKVRRVSDGTKPWFELTTEEVQEIHKWVKFKEEGTGPLPVEKLVRYISHKLREKNGG